MKYIIIFIHVFLFISCQKAVEYDIPEGEHKIAIEARINAGDTVTALINLSSSVLSIEGPDYNVEADVYLFEDDIPVDTLTLEQPFLGLPNSLTNYKSDYVAKVGHNYRLEAQTENVEMAFGKTSVPEEPQVISLQIDNTKDLVTIRIKDNPNRKDYYLIDFKWNTDQIIPIPQSSGDPTLQILYSSNDFIADNDIYTGYISVINDDTFNGQIKKLEIGYIPDEALSQTNKVQLIIKHITYDFYQHERTKAAQLNAIDLLLPTIAEVHSNITNGYGVVIGSADSTVIFTP